MSLVDKRISHRSGNSLIYEELEYDRDIQLQEHDVLFSGLNVDQTAAYNAIVKAVESRSGGLFFVYGHGGTGKTYLYKIILALIRLNDDIALSVASSGIASLLLPGGRTAHSRFHIPIDVNEDFICDIKQGSQEAELLMQARIILWDEAPMAHKSCFEALDRTIRDVMRKQTNEYEEKVFAGKVVVLGGDFRQILPVVRKGSRDDIVNAVINKSYLWKECIVLKLEKNMRLLRNDIDEKQKEELELFSKWILDVGDGNLEDFDGEGIISIPTDLLVEAGNDKVKAIVDNTYPELVSHMSNPTYLRECAIVSLNNKIVESVYDYMVNLVSAEEIVYRSANSICNAFSPMNDSSGVEIRIEYLKSLKIPGLPNRLLRLKVGLPIMMLRNVNPRNGLCNGTRLVITRLCTRVIEAEIITGSGIRTRLAIPRITLSPSDLKYPFVIK